MDFKSKRGICPFEPIEEILENSESHLPQRKGVGHHRHRAEGHCHTGNDGAEQRPGKRIENARSDGNTK